MLRYHGRERQVAGVVVVAGHPLLGTGPLTRYNCVNLEYWIVEPTPDIPG